MRTMSLGPDDLGMQGKQQKKWKPQFHQIFWDTQYNNSSFLPDKIPLSFLLQRSSNTVEEREEGPGRRKRKKKKKSQDNIQIVVYYQSPCFLVRWTSCHYITINILSHMTLLVGAQGIFGFTCGSAGKESSCNEGDLSLIPGLWQFPWKRERLSTPVLGPGEFHGLLVHGVTKSWTRLSDFHFQGLLIEWWKTLKSK